MAIVPPPQVVAIAMDLLTDLQIIQDLLDVSSRRGVAIYVVLEARGVPHFLDMCSRLQISATHLRVRKSYRVGGGVNTGASAGRRPTCCNYQGLMSL